MLKFELSLGANDGPNVSTHWVDCPDLAQVTDEEWNQNLLIWDQVKNSLFAFLGGLGPIPPEGWSVKFWLDAKNVPKSVVDAAYTGHWKQRGFMGPPPAKSIEDEKPKKKSPVEEMLNYFDCARFIEKKYSIETDNRNPRSNSLWLWLLDNDGDALQRKSQYYLITNPESPSYYMYDNAPEHFRKILALFHKEFAEQPEDEGVQVWIS